MTNWTLEDFDATTVEGGVMFQHKEYLCGAVLYDEFIDVSSDEVILNELKAAIRRAGRAGQKGD